MAGKGRILPVALSHVPAAPDRGWTRHFVRRREALKTTWLARGLLTVFAAVVISLLWVLLIPRIGPSLVCSDAAQPSDAILVENFDPSYLVFERARELRRANLAPVTLVPTEGGEGPGDSNPASAGIAEVMARVSRLPDPWTTIPITVTEPISLNAALQIRTALQARHVRSVIVVSPGFRSRRSLLVYSRVFGEAGIATSCVPVFGARTPANWTRTWHGLQEVAEQFIKLQYYQRVVMQRAIPKSA